jgi:hypothetical protein
LDDTRQSRPPYRVARCSDCGSRASSAAFPPSRQQRGSAPRRPSPAATERRKGPGFPRTRVHDNLRPRPDPRPRFHATGGLSATSGRALLVAKLGHHVLADSLQTIGSKERAALTRVGSYSGLIAEAVVGACVGRSAHRRPRTVVGRQAVRSRADKAERPCSARTSRASAAARFVGAVVTETTESDARGHTRADRASVRDEGAARGERRRPQPCR